MGLYSSPGISFVGFSGMLVGHTMHSFSCPPALPFVKGRSSQGGWRPPQPILHGCPCKAACLLAQSLKTHHTKLTIGDEYSTVLKSSYHIPYRAATSYEYYLQGRLCDSHTNSVDPEHQWVVTFPSDKTSHPVTVSYGALWNKYSMCAVAAQKCQSCDHCKVSCEGHCIAP